MIFQPHSRQSIHSERYEPMNHGFADALDRPIKWSLSLPPVAGRPSHVPDDGTPGSDAKHDQLVPSWNCQGCYHHRIALRATSIDWVELLRFRPMSMQRGAQLQLTVRLSCSWSLILQVAPYLWILKFGESTKSNPVIQRSSSPGTQLWAQLRTSPSGFDYNLILSLSKFSLPRELDFGDDGLAVLSPATVFR